MLISKTTPLHLIWFGCPLPNAEQYPYIDRVKEFAKINPNRPIYLWYDKNTYLDMKEYQEMQGIKKESEKEFPNIKFLDIHEDLKFFVSDKSDDKLLDSVLSIIFNMHNNITKNGIDKVNNYGNSSDWARGIILYLIGGIYFDIDAKPIKEIPDLESKYGLKVRKSVNKYYCYKLDETSSSIVGDNIDCIAITSHNEFLKKN